MKVTRQNREPIGVPINSIPPYAFFEQEGNLYQRFELESGTVQCARLYDNFKFSFLPDTMVNLVEILEIVYRLPLR